MAPNAQITIEPFCGEENENVWEFEQLFRGIIGVAAVSVGQQADFTTTFTGCSITLFSNALRSITSERRFNVGSAERSFL